MLSEKSEKFLKKFRIEMMARGKDDEYRDNLEEELRDHLMLAEQNGEDLESVTGGSVKNYMKTLSIELPETNHLRRKILLIFIFLVGMFTIPSLIGGDFDYTLSMFIYYVSLTLFGPFLFYLVIKFIFIHFTDLETEKISTAGIVLCGLYGVIYMALLVGGLYLADRYPIYEFMTLSSKSNMIAGLFLLGIFVFGTVVMGRWFYTFLIIALSLPELSAKIFVGGDPKDENYIIVSAIVLFVVSAVVMTVLFFYSKKEVDD